MKPTVLLVDDERLVTEAMKRSLRREPYEVLTAGSGEQALDLMKQHEPDVIVADEKMPGMAGTELLAIVRREHPSTMRIILTGCGTLETAMRAINEGEIYRFFTKPYHEADLVQTIREALEHKRLTADAKNMLRIIGRGLDWNDCLSPLGE